MYSAPVSVYDDALEVYSSDQLNFMSQMLKKVPLNMHYILYPVYIDGGTYGQTDPGINYVQYVLAYGPEVEVGYDHNYGDRYTTSLRVFSSTGNITLLFVNFRNYDLLWGSTGWDLPFMGDIRIVDGVSSFTIYRDFSPYNYNKNPWFYKYVYQDRELEWPFVTDSGRKGIHAMWGVWSDVGYFPDLRDSEEVYDHAQTVILASFVLFAVFRSLWRSIRGRDT